MVASTAARPARERRLFLDAVRGWALILTVLHHTSRLWQDAVMLLVLVLVAMGRGWQAVKRWYRDHGPALGVFGRA